MSMEPRIQAPRVRSVAEHIALFFFCLATVGFMAQAVVNMFAAGFESATGAPLHVVFVLIAGGCLITRSETIVWLIAGKGREVLAFTILLLFIVAYYDASSFGWGLRKYMRSIQVTIGMILYVVAFLLCRREDNLRVILRVWFIMAGISGCVSTLEMLLGVSVPWSIYEGGGQHAGGGLEYSPVPFSYSVAGPAAIATTLVLARARPYADPGRLISMFAMIAGAVGTVASASRSGLLGIVVGSAFGLLLLGRERRAIPIMALSGIAAGLATATGITRYVAKQGVEGDPRLYDTWVAYFPIAITAPMGAGPRSTIQMRLALLKEAEILLSIKVEPAVASRAFEIAPHNAWLTAGLAYGWLGLFCLFAIYAFVLLRGLLVMAQGAHLERGEKVLMSALIAGLVAYLGHSGFHNSSIFIGEMRGFISLAIVTSVAITLSERARARARAAQAQRVRDYHARDTGSGGMPAPDHSH